jgi:hypothetical protein
MSFYALLTLAVGFGGLLVIGAGVLVFAIAVLVVGPLNDRASEPPRCPVCRSVVVPAVSATIERSAATAGASEPTAAPSSPTA